MESGKYGQCEELKKKVINKTRFIIKQVVLKLFQKISSDEREFCRIWPQIDSIEGYLVSPIQERWLFKTARSLPDDTTIVEIGSFKGRSTCCLAYGCKGTKKHVFAIDTFDGNYVDFHRKDFFKEFWQNIEKCELTSYVSPITGWSSDISETWNRPIHLLFIDGSHQFQDVLDDFNGFFPHVAPKGVVAVHDVVETWPETLKAWHEVIKHQLDKLGTCNSLAYGIKPR